MIDPHATPHPDRAGGSRSQRHLSAHRPPHPPSSPHPVGERGTGPHSRGVRGLSQSGIRPAQAGGGVVRTGSCACHTRRRGLGLRGLQLWAQLQRCQVGESAWGLHTAARGHPTAAQSQAQWPPQPGRATGAGALGREAVGFVFKFTTHLFSLFCFHRQ